MTVKVLSVDALRLDGDTQARISVNTGVVEEYAEVIAAEKEWPFETVTAFFDGSDYWLADGFHRTLAAKKAGRASVPCTVITGTARDARIHGMTANDLHGLRMSRDDRKKNVIWLLENYQEMTQIEIAEKAGVSLRLVNSVCSDLKKQMRNLRIPTPETLGKSENETPEDPDSGEEPPFDDVPQLTAKQLKEAEQAKKAAAKEAEKVRKAAEKEAEKAAKAKAAAEAKAAKEAEREAAKAVRAKAKEEEKAAKKAARAKAREEEKEAKRKALPRKEQEAMVRDLFNQHVGRVVKAMCELLELKPNRAAYDHSMKMLNQVKLW